MRVFSESELEVIRAFHLLLRNHLFDEKCEHLPSYRGIRIMKFPSDIWFLQEIVCSTKPDFIVEVGTLFGGLALFLGDVCESLGCGQVIAVDSGELLGAVPTFDGCKRVTGLVGDCGVVFPKVKELVGVGRVMVILDCCHLAEHVLGELLTYGSLVTQGCYLVVEDTDVRIGVEGLAGPKAALDEFLSTHSEFEQDLSQHKFLVTTNPGGYLRRK